VISAPYRRRSQSTVGSAARQNGQMKSDQTTIRSGSVLMLSPQIPNLQRQIRDRDNP
jgi:hypothetical protein